MRRSSPSLAANAESGLWQQTQKDAKRDPVGSSRSKVAKAGVVESRRTGWDRVVPNIPHIASALPSVPAALCRDQFVECMTIYTLGGTHPQANTSKPKGARKRLSEEGSRPSGLLELQE